MADAAVIASLEVDIVAYGGSEPHAALLANPSIHIHIMKQWPTFRQSLPKILQPIMLLLKPLVQFFMLLYFLCVKIPSPDIFIVQVRLVYRNSAEVHTLELVRVDKNGLLFSSSSELADELLMLFKGFPDECDALKVLKNGFDNDEFKEIITRSHHLQQLISAYLVTLAMENRNYSLMTLCIK
ncbi:hypothetical protein RIF29_32906 [Crotalaria pallida]|uniref:Uncharacterized protein n=1 Tax=Crotalaria pallida TaxID=3830 RepID=A0AAN9ED14_CROPI